MGQPQNRPESAGDLKAKEAETHADVVNLASHGDGAAAYHVYQDAYKELAAKNPAQASQFVRDMTARFRNDEGVSQILAQQFGLELQQGKPGDSSLSQSQLTQLAKSNKSDAFTQAMASELSNDIPKITSSTDGGFFGIGGHPADHASKADLDRAMDYNDGATRTIDMGRGLLYGGHNSPFEQIARFAHKNPDDPNQPLNLSDLQNFAAANGSKLPRAERDLIQNVIERWNDNSLNSLAEHFDGATLLSKRSINKGLHDVNSPDR